jgi:hypothetical protein
VVGSLGEARGLSGVTGVFGDAWGNPEVTDEQIQVMQQTLPDSSTVDKVQTIITEGVDRALSALDAAEIDHPAQSELLRLANAVVTRASYTARA